ncbi:hypothetical protein DFP73DRAFT_511339 [Morchella snyderi]|nr:hypothetical protein DFP73DRAFT_511339 [Morchella snyderi]
MSADHLDELMLAYLDTIDTYQSQSAALASGFSNGFMALAQANFNTPGRRFGQDSYDERMAATRGVEIRQRGEGGGEAEEEEGVITFHGLRIPLAAATAESESGGVRAEEAPKEEDGGGGDDDGDDSETETPGGSECGEKPVEKPDPRDPLRWFGILVPRALRTAQTEFTGCVELVPRLLTTLSRLSLLESRAARGKTRHLYKILPEAPPAPLPGALALSALDAGAGFIHMCTSAQVPGVVGGFMGGAASVWLLKIPIGRVEGGGALRWEGAVVNGAVGERFPHLYGAGIGVAEVLDWKEFRKGEGGWGGVFDAASAGWVES